MGHYYRSPRDANASPKSTAAGSALLSEARDTSLEVGCLWLVLSTHDFTLSLQASNGGSFIQMGHTDEISIHGAEGRGVGRISSRRDQGRVCNIFEVLSLWIVL